MCCPKGYGFEPFWSENGYRFLTFCSNLVWLSGERSQKLINLIFLIFLIFGYGFLRKGLKTSVGNGIFCSEIRPGFEDAGGTPPPKI